MPRRVRGRKRPYGGRVKRQPRKDGDALIFGLVWTDLRDHAHRPLVAEQMGELDELVMVTAAGATDDLLQQIDVDLAVAPSRERSCLPPPGEPDLA